MITYEIRKIVFRRDYTTGDLSNKVCDEMCIRMRFGGYSDK